MATGAIMRPLLVAATNGLSYAHFPLSLFRRQVSPSCLSIPTRHSSLSYPKHPQVCSVLGAAEGGGAVLYDAAATGVVAAAAYALISTFDTLTKRNIIDQECFLSHWGCGLMAMYVLPLQLSCEYINITRESEQKVGPYTIRVTLYGFLANLQILDSTSIEARYFASLVPLFNCSRLVIYGFSLVKDDALIKSLTRKGNPEELLRGPLFYVLILILCALVFWRESPVGVIAVAMMCGGDGIADIVGRRFGNLKLPYNQQKSWAGSISMLLFGFLISIGMLCYFSAFGYFHLDWTSTIQRVALISMVATVVESLPTTTFLDDNISVPLVSILTAILTFGY